MSDTTSRSKKKKGAFYSSSKTTNTGKGKGSKRQFFLSLPDKRRTKNAYPTNPPLPIDSTTIPEDDESEQLQQIPMLPDFNNFGSYSQPDLHVDSQIPRPTSKSETDDDRCGIKQEIKKNSSMGFLDKNETKILKSTIDDDFDINFSKDSKFEIGEQILRFQRPQGVAQRRAVVEASSSDDDVSTENESEDVEEANHSLKKYQPESDNVSFKSNASHDSKKNIFQKLFRRRGFSIGAESHESTKNEKDSETKNIESVNMDQSMSPSQFSINKEKETRETEKSIEESDQKEKVSIGSKEGIVKAKKESSINQSSVNSIENVSLHSVGGGKQFLKNVFHLDGLLGQGGLIPNVNLLHVRKGDQVYDNENPPPLNFQDEIKEEAQTLVGRMVHNPLDELRHRITPSGRTAGTSKKGKDDSNRENLSSTNYTNESTTDLNATTDTSSGIFVPQNAHLPVDPFDDLQDFDNFSIDVPENISHKPRKYRAGIQSALFQLYNTHMMPSTATSISTVPTTASREGTSVSFNDSETNYDSDMNESTLALSDLHMDIGNKIRKNGLDALASNEAKTTLITELPEIGTKMEEISQDAHSRFDGFSKVHRRANSLQDRILRTEKRKSQFPSIKPGNKKKTDVTFELPNFVSKPTLAGDSAYEKAEIMGYKRLKKRARFNKNLTKESTARITVHIADVLERQRFILTLCKAFMLYGAPTHRLEEYMSMTAQVLEIDGSFIYFPGCMLVSFGDLNARTSEMKLVRCAQGLDLGKLDEVHDVYKNVVHDRLGTVEGYEILDEVMNRKPKFSPWWCIFFYSVASVAVAPWSFGGSWIDLPICFGIGSIIGFLQFVVCPKNTLYSSVFEVSSSIIASFIARAIGSVNGGTTFCYAAIVQSSLALILPGYIILCGSLELQSRNIVAGSVRMFYAFIYSLMLSFGITLGAALYGWIDKNATSATSCDSNISPWFRFLFIPMFTIGIALTNQASWSQLPMMCIISGSGYVVTYFSSLHFKQVTELNATLGCFIIGLISNIYSRYLKSFNKYFTSRGTFMTVSLMLPAIFVQVPSGIASQGSVFTGITVANNIVHSKNSTSSSSSDTNSLSFGMVMIQVALGISVGLYLSTILVYPLGKKKTGIFTL